MEDLFSICGLIFGQQKCPESLEITNLNSVIDSIFNKELMQYAVEHVGSFKEIYLLKNTMILKYILLLTLFLTMNNSISVLVLKASENEIFLYIVDYSIYPTKVVMFLNIFTSCIPDIKNVFTIFLNSYEETRKCTFGDKCTQAHSKEELQEWKERFKFRTQQIKRARDKHLHGNTYAEQLMEKLVNAENSKSVVSIAQRVKTINSRASIIYLEW